MKAKKPYQDIWRDGALVQKGRRDCAMRYAAIRRVLERELGRGFSVADVGGWDGYFAVRLAEDLDARSLNVDTRDISLPVPHLRMRVTAETVVQIGEQDAILALSVLHHMPDWREVYAGLKAQCLLLVVEVCHPGEADAEELSPTLAKAAPLVKPQHKTIEAEAESLICRTPALDDPRLQRPTYLVRCGARGKVEDGTKRASALMSKLSSRDWESLGYTPFPGTLNVAVGESARQWLMSKSDIQGPGLRRSPDYVAVTANGYPCHGKFSKDVRTVELVAPVFLREELQVENGDQITVRLR